MPVKRISEFKDRLINRNQSAKQKKMKKNEQSREICGKYKAYNICIIGAPKGEREKSAENSILENFPNLIKKKILHIQKLSELQ